jgi:hypothetical protein
MWPVFEMEQYYSPLTDMNKDLVLLVSQLEERKTERGASVKKYAMSGT